MATRRISSRRGLGATLVANPGRNSLGQFTRNPRRRRNPRRNAGYHKYGPSTKKGGMRLTSRRAYEGLHKKRKRKRNPTTRRRKNPIGGFSLAGVPVVDAALGGLGALVVANTLKNIPMMDAQLDKIENKALKAALPSALTLGLSVLIHQYAKGAFKDIAKWMVAASTFKLVDDATDAYFATEFPKMFGDSGKVAADANKAGKAAEDQTKADVKASGAGAANGYFGGAYMPVDTLSGSKSLGGAYLDLNTGGSSSHATFGIH